MRTRRCKINLIVNLELFTCPIVGHRVSQAQPAIPRIAYAGLKFDGKLIIVKVECHLSAKVSAGFNATPPHHRVDVEPKRALDCRPPAASSAAVSAHFDFSPDFAKSTG
jgi:hypothetical protein